MAEHNGDEAGAGAADHVEVLLGLERVENDYGLLEDHERGRLHRGRGAGFFRQALRTVFQEVPIDGRLRL